MFKTNKRKWFFTGIAFLLITIVLVGFGIKLNKQEKTVTLNGLNYSIGAISSTTGKNVDSKLSIYTKNYGNVDGMEIKLNEDATITFKVAFYDEDKHFIAMSDALDEDFDTEDIESGSKYFRVVVTPNQVDGEDVKLNVINFIQYANMLKITYNK